MTDKMLSMMLMSTHSVYKCAMFAKHTRFYDISKIMMFLLLTFINQLNKTYDNFFPDVLGLSTKETSTQTDVTEDFSPQKYMFNETSFTCIQDLKHMMPSNFYFTLLVIQ